MRVAHLLPASATFPLKTHNGRYEWALRLARIQVEQGHTVTIYSNVNSKDENTELNFQGQTHDFQNKTINNLALLSLAMKSNDYDIFHSHFDFLHFFTADQSQRPIVYGQHWFPNQHYKAAAQINTHKNAIAVPVTKLMALEYKKLGLRSSGVIYHGIDLSLFTPSTKPRSDRYIFVGRIAPHKGVKQAVEIALKAGIKLDIVGKINPTDQAYWISIEPMIDGDNIRYLGPKSHEELVSLISRSKAMLFPSQIVESFGQTIIESQACGTPVIMQNIGPASELIQNGKTGFVVDTVEDYFKAIKNIDTINPSDCRSHAEKFNLQDMAVKYTDLYNSLLQ